PDALEQTKQVEFALGLHAVEDFIGRKILDANDEVVAKVAKAPRQPAIGLRCECLDIGQGWRRQAVPIAEFTFHGNVVREVHAATKRLTAWPQMRNGWRSGARRNRRCGEWQRGWLGSVWFC